MDLIALSPLDLGISAALVATTAALSWRMGLGIEGRLGIAALRSAVQLLLIGYVLKLLFEVTSPLLIGLMASVMLVAAGFEVLGRQQRRLRGLWGFGVGTLSMFLSSFAVLLLALAAIVQPEPWYRPQYLIPLLGMLLGNSMSGIAIALDQLTRNAALQRPAIEGQLLLGRSGAEAIREIRREAMRAGLIPIINAMGAAGIVSLPGMMTGQILAGGPPLEAAKYQIMILFLIAGGTGIGTLFALWIGSRRLFDERDRLRLDRLT